MTDYATQPGLTHLLIPKRLDGTRTSANWKTQPGGMDRLNTRAVFPSSNEWDIPDLPHVDHLPTGLVAYNEPRAIATAQAGAAVHFFLDDYRFETLWSHPQRGLPRCQITGLALTPDFSMWPDMPMVMQQWQVYRSRWCGAWLLAHGVDIVPTVTWSTPRTHAFAFAGIARGSTVAISSVGLRNDLSRRLFAAGCEALLEHVAPSRVLIYGASEQPDAMFTTAGVLVQNYPTRWANGR